MLICDCKSELGHAWPVAELLAFRMLGLSLQDSVREAPVAYAEQLALARAYLGGDPAARRRFDAEFGDCLRSGVARICADPVFTDETVQQLSARLLAGPDAKLATYSGSGPLRAWLQLVASRAALDALRAAGRRRRYERSAAVATKLPLPGIESNFERGRYASRVGAALSVALRSLSAHERNLLKMRFSEGLELEAIGACQGVHRATVARWLASLCSRLEHDVQRQLGQQGVNLSASELRGVGRTLQCRLTGAVDSWLQRSSSPGDERG